MNEKIFPTMLIVINVLAAVVYVTKGDYPRTGYWIMAAGITFFTLLIK
jgi:hypothetical protein